MYFFGKKLFKREVWKKKREKEKGKERARDGVWGMIA